MLMHSKHRNLSFERLLTSRAARGKHLFLHLPFNLALLIQQIVGHVAFAKINVSH